MSINWDLILYFRRNEFSEDPNLYAHPELIQDLDDFRLLLGTKIYPSPASGALARFTGPESSQHFALNKYSTAIDIFPDCDIFKAWTTAIQFGWNGIGIYFDTYFRGKLWPMLHLDKRKDKLLWIRDCNKNYIYNNELLFYKKLSILLYNHNNKNSKN